MDEKSKETMMAHLRASQEALWEPLMQQAVILHRISALQYWYVRYQYPTN